MYKRYTYQDWMKSPTPEMISRIITDYKTSSDFIKALEAKEYFAGRNTSVMQKHLLKTKIDKSEDSKGRTVSYKHTVEINGNQIPTAFFRHAVIQQVQYLLGNGVTLDDSELKARLGYGFDHSLELLGENSCIAGVAWGFWNMDHLEVIEAAADNYSGFAGLVDEMTGLVRVGIQFWQISDSKPLYVRLFEEDGYTVFAGDKKAGVLSVIEAKKPYMLTVSTDALGEQVIGGHNYTSLPVIPFYANSEKASELSVSIKSKIDAYDTILSDFGDNLEQANDVYWVLNNFGGSIKEALEIKAQIDSLKMVVNQGDGVTGASAAPHTFEVPYAARQTALALLERAMYKDYMALNMESLTGGSLTNVAIKAAMADINLKADRFEWCAFQFVHNVLKLIGVETENIVFKRQSISNETETVQDIYTMRSDIDLRTALELNPYIAQDDIDTIIANKEAEESSGFPSVDELQRAMDEESEEQ